MLKEKRLALWMRLEPTVPVSTSKNYASSHMRKSALWLEFLLILVLLNLDMPCLHKQCVDPDQLASEKPSDLPLIWTYAVGISVIVGIVVGIGVTVSCVCDISLMDWSVFIRLRPRRLWTSFVDLHGYIGACLQVDKILQWFILALDIGQSLKKNLDVRNFACLAMAVCVAIAVFRLSFFLCDVYKKQAVSKTVSGWSDYLRKQSSQYC